MALLVFILLFLLSYCPVACRASWVRGEQQQGMRGQAVVTRRSRNHVGRKRSTRTPAAIRSSGFVPASGLGGGVGRELAAGGSQQRYHSRGRVGRRECQTREPRAMPPLDDHGRKGQAAAAGPLKAINPDAIYTANDWIAAVAGGSVGVMGTLIQLELKQEKLRRRRNCPYCDGSGKLVCARCCCSGKFVTKLPGMEETTSLPCPGCGGAKYIECLNCRGDGRAVPRELDRKTADAAEVDLRLEEIGMSNMVR